MTEAGSFEMVVSKHRQAAIGILVLKGQRDILKPISVSRV